jgi:hypothetical protein
MRRILSVPADGCVNRVVGNGRVRECGYIGQVVIVAAVIIIVVDETGRGGGGSACEMLLVTQRCNLI